MNKNIFIWIFGIFLLSSFASADFDTNLNNNFAFNEATITNGMIDNVSGYNLSTCRGVNAVNQSNAMNPNSWKITSAGTIASGCYGTSAFPLGNLATDDNFTISIWFNHTSASTTLDTIISNFAWEGTRIGFYCWDNSGSFLCGHSGMGWGANLDLPAITLNKWYQLILRKQGTNYSAFVNGTYITSTLGNNAITWSGNGNEFSAGGLYGSSNNYWGWNGHLDELNIWDRGLSDAEISDLYNDGTGKFYPTFGVDTTSPTASDWNVTSGNVINGENTSIWNTNDTIINITSGILSYTFTASEASNHSAYVDSKTDYSGSDSNHKAATTDTTSHANTVYDSFAYGNHYLFISLTDSSGNIMNYTKNFTRYDYPNVTLVSPENTSTDTDGKIEFTFKPIWHIGSLDNCSLYGNFSGSWELNQTNTSGFINNTNFIFNQINLIDGDYLWNVQCCNEKGMCNFSMDNYTVKVEDITKNYGTIIVGDMDKYRTMIVSDTGWIK